MAIDSARKREASLLLGGPLVPDGTVDLADRTTLLEQYGGYLIAEMVARLVSFRLYIARSRTVMTGESGEADGMKIERSRAVDLYVERSRALSLNLV